MKQVFIKLLKIKHVREIEPIYHTLVEVITLDGADKTTRILKNNKTLLNYTKQVECLQNGGEALLITKYTRKEMK